MESGWQSSFLWGYLLSPIAGGALADRYGGKVVMACGVALWSLATLATPWAARQSLPVLLAVRVLMGLAEGVAMPCMNNMISKCDFSATPSLRKPILSNQSSFPPGLYPPLAKSKMSIHAHLGASMERNYPQIISWWIF